MTKYFKNRMETDGQVNYKILQACGCEEEWFEDEDGDASCPGYYIYDV